MGPSLLTTTPKNCYPSSLSSKETRFCPCPYCLDSTAVHFTQAKAVGRVLGGRKLSKPWGDQKPCLLWGTWAERENISDLLVPNSASSMSLKPLLGSTGGGGRSTSDP